MLKSILIQLSKKLKKPAIILGAAGFSSTVIACYGPPPNVYHGELGAAAEDILYDCADGSSTDEYCPYGCQNGACIEKFGNEGDSCVTAQYVDSCSDDDNFKRSCVDGKITNTACSNCRLNDTGVTCDDANAPNPSQKS